MNDLDLAWRVEEACFNGCPSPREMLLNDRWMVRIAGGATRRINSVNPLRADTYDPHSVIDIARHIFSAHERPLIFRAPTIALGLDAQLDRVGFIARGAVSTLVAPLGDTTSGAGVHLDREPSEAWLAAKSRLTPNIGRMLEAYRSMIAAILAPKIFASLSQDGGIACVAYGVVHERILVVESVVTDPLRRRRGCGRRVVAALMAWARSSGAEIACLQVESDNAAAIALYRSLGFADELYNYRYFHEP